APRLSAIFGPEHAAVRNRNPHSAWSPGIDQDAVEEDPCLRLRPTGPRRMAQQSPVRLPALAAVTANEQPCRIDTGEEHVRLGRMSRYDLPDPAEREAALRAIARAV